MQVQEAWAVWASAVAHGAKGIDLQALEGAVGTLFHPRKAAELWQAVTEGEGSPLGLAATLKAALQQLLRDLELAGSGVPQLLTGAQATVGTLKLVNNLVVWHQQLRETRDWCAEQWRPVVDLLTGWAPAVFEACLDRLMLSDVPRVQPSGVIQLQELGKCSEEEAVKSAASRCLNLATCFLDGGAADWLRPSPLLQALSAWICIANRVGKHFEPVENQQTRPEFQADAVCPPTPAALLQGPFELRHLVLLLLNVLSRHDAERRFTQYRGHLARSLAKDHGLLLATARLSLFAASSEIPYEYGEACTSLAFWALQILGCSELQPAIVQACISDGELHKWLLQSSFAATDFVNAEWEAASFHSGAIVCESSSGGGSSGTSSSKHDITSAGSDDGNSVGFNRTHLKFAVNTAGVFWSYSCLLVRLQQRLVDQGHKELAQAAQWACYAALRSVHGVLSEVLISLSACSNAGGYPDAAQGAWQPSNQPEQQLLWELAVSSRGALDNLVSVLTTDRLTDMPAGCLGDEVSPQQASGELVLLRSVLEAGALYLSVGTHPFWHSLWAGVHAAAQQEPGLQIRDGLGVDSQAAEHAAEERALLALQYHLEKLVELPGHATLRSVLLNLVSAQKVALMRLATSDAGDQIFARRNSLETHLNILAALLPSIRAACARHAVEADECSIGDCHDRQLQGAAFQALLSLIGLCHCFDEVKEVTAALSCWDHERTLQQSVQRANVALTVTCQAAVMGVIDDASMAGVLMLLREALGLVEGYLQEELSNAAMLLSHVEDLLKHVAGCIAVPSMAIAMVAGHFCPRLAEFLIRVLHARYVLTEDYPQFSASVLRIQKLGCQLIRTCTQAVDGLAGTDLLEGERELEAAGGHRVREWMADGSDLRTAALQVAISTWCHRTEGTLPRLTYVARAAHAAGLQRELPVVTPAVSSGGGSPSGEGHGGVFVVAVQRELSVSAILACANPLCPGQAAAFGRGTRLRLCAGCRGVRYCSDDCAQLDWMRHRPCCKALRLISGAVESRGPGAIHV